MHSMQDEEVDRDERSSKASHSTAPDRLGTAPCGVFIRDPGTGTVGWSSRYERYLVYGRELISIPKLYLGHAVTLRLVARQPYHAALAGCTVEVPAEGVHAPFHVIRATFPFYRTSEAALDGVLLVVNDGRPLGLAEAVRLLTVPPQG